MHDRINEHDQLSTWRRAINRPTRGWGARNRLRENKGSLQQTRSANRVNELPTVNATVGEQWADSKYDSNGNMTAIPRPGLNRPSWANLTTDQWSALTVDGWSRMEVAPTFKPTYDAWNRLVKLTDGGIGETVQENQYDGRGYRIVTKTYTDGTLSETRHAYLTDQWQCIEERLGSSTTPDRQFVWGMRYIDDGVAQTSLWMSGLQSNKRRSRRRSPGFILLSLRYPDAQSSVWATPPVRAARSSP